MTAVLAHLFEPAFFVVLPLALVTMLLLLKVLRGGDDEEDDEGPAG